jgi:hypothetical protein
LVRAFAKIAQSLSNAWIQTGFLQIPKEIALFEQNIAWRGVHD